MSKVNTNCNNCKELIPLFSRTEGVASSLTFVSKNKYKFSTTSSYYRYGIPDNPTKPIELTFIDPDGGPFLAPGYKLSDTMLVDKIIMDADEIYVLTKDV